MMKSAKLLEGEVNDDILAAMYEIGGEGDGDGESVARRHNIDQRLALQ